MLTMIKHFVSLFFVYLIRLHFTHSLSSDGLSLLSLKSAVDDGDTIFSDWNEDDSDACRWTGISCSNISGEPHVVGIVIPGKNLAGYIPSELGKLTYLRRINFGDNDFHGSIPEQLFNATSLHSIILHGNNLSGELPSSICNLPLLQKLDLSYNRFSNSLPKELSNCRKLQQLILARNKFSGQIPAGIFPELANLVQLDLSMNFFTGKIPEDIGELKSLSGTLNMSYNNLSGNIPKSLGNLPLTVNFDLRNNELSGEIPKTGAFANQGQKAFSNNPLLCGFPVQRSCDDDISTQNSSGAKNFSPWSDDNNAKNGLNLGLIVLISLADAVGIAFIGILIVYVYWRNRSCHGCSCTRQGKLGGNVRDYFCSFPCILDTFSSGSDSEVESEKGGGGGEGDLVAIDKGFSIELDELLRASAYVLGKSRLGIVYKVVLGNGVPVAVRRLGEGGEERHKEFVAEIQSIARVKHPNVVKLRAYYWAPDEKLIVTDFISNGNLVSALHGRHGRPSSNLSWPTRLRIAKCTARGLAYIHECSPRKFVHGNIKPSNILLDNEFQPYISDFGLNRLIEIAGNNPSSGGLIGGAFPYIKSLHSEQANYRAPEARLSSSSNRPVQKWDVYSFGVVLLELLTGKSSELSSASASTSAEVLDLVQWVRKGFEDESPLTDMADAFLLKEVQAKKEVQAVFHIALACTDDDPEIRPRMKIVSENLEKVRS